MSSVCRNCERPLNGQPVTPAFCWGRQCNSHAESLCLTRYLGVAAFASSPPLQKSALAVPHMPPSS